MEQKLMDYNDNQRMKTLASRSDGDRPWFIDMDDWGGDLNNQEIRIIDKNNKTIFTMVGGSLDHAAYVISLNNEFIRSIKETK
jgi:hypothetical protein